MGTIVTDRDKLARLIADHKAAGRKVVVANGNFDLMHVGHIRYLRGAAGEGHVLVVAINSDEAVREAKGPDRPITPLAERMEIVSAIEGVTYVTWFDEPTCDVLLEQLHPQVHAKGPDYTAENLPERHTVARLGIRFAVVGDPKSHTSSGLLERIKRPNR